MYKLWTRHSHTSNGQMCESKWCFFTVFSQYFVLLRAMFPKSDRSWLFSYYIYWLDVGVGTRGWVHVQ